MSTLRTVARGVAVLGVSRVAIAVSAFAFTVVQARILGPGHFGELAVALTYAGLLAIVVDFGLGTQLNRLVAQQRFGRDDALALTLATRIGLWLAATPIVLGIGAALGYAADMQLALILLALSVLMVGIANGIASFLQGQERFGLPALATVAQSFVSAGSGALLLLVRPEITSVAWAFMIGALTGVVVLVTPRGVRAALRGVRLERERVVALLRGALPLGMYAIATTFYFGVDMILLQRLAPAENLGWYAAAYRLFGAATVFPSIVAGTVLYPVCARLSVGSRDELRTVVEKALSVLTVAGVLVALLFALFADDIVAALYPAGAYAGAAASLRLLTPGLVCIFLNWILSTVLLGLGAERRLVAMAFSSALANVLMNLVAIPLLREEGAAITTSVTELIVLVWLVRLMPRDLLRPVSLRVAGKAFAAAAITGAALLPVLGAPLAITAPAAVALYAAGVFATRTVTTRELSALAAALPLRSARPEAP
jgi:O-antigen/teichoic acid export membrane protein